MVGSVNFSRHTNMPEAVFFDMDGLLVDTEPYWLETERELMADFGVIWRSEDQLYCLGGPMQKVGDYMSSLAQGRESSEWFAEELINRMAKKFANINLMPGIADLLDEIHALGLSCALVSASPRRLVDAVLAIFDLSRSLSQLTMYLEVSRTQIHISKQHSSLVSISLNRSSLKILQRVLLLREQVVHS